MVNKISMNFYISNEFISCDQISFTTHATTFNVENLYTDWKKQLQFKMLAIIQACT